MMFRFAHLDYAFVWWGKQLLNIHVVRGNIKPFEEELNRKMLQFESIQVSLAQTIRLVKPEISIV